MIRLVIGPPGAGKSTFIQGKQGPKDLVIELDRFRELADSDDTARLLRGAVESKASNYAGDVWIARTLASANDVEAYCKRVGVDEVIVLDTDASTCKERVMARDGNEDLFQAIDRWFEQYDPGSSGSDMEEIFMSSDKSKNGVEADSQESKATESEQGSPAPKQESVEEFLVKENEHGFPDDTPIEKMSYKQQAAYWKFHSRKHESALKKVSKEPVVEDAHAEPESPLLRKLFDAEFRAATVGIGKDLGALKESLDMSKFLDADGGIDGKKLAEVIEAVKPSKPAGAPVGGASTSSYEGATGYEYGLELYNEKYKINGGS
ncbi:hypothetical protein ACN082_09805 [Rothia sp. CCM 9417]|uniref:hypothetical protein n=1 Tax=Rothia sp. CCM 9417 TaxID=3402657 RepID=UPI003AD9F80C